MMTTWIRRCTRVVPAIACPMLATALHGCVRPPSNAATEDARAGLFARAAALDTAMGLRGFVDPLASAFGATGVYISAAPLSHRGPEAARAALSTDSLNATSRARWTIVGHGTSADGRDGYTFGHFLVVRAAGDSLPGSYKAYWRRSPDGQWQLLAMQRARVGAWPRPDQPFEVAAAPGHQYLEGDADTVTLLRAVMATELEFSNAAAQGIGQAFAAFAAPDGAKAGPERFMFGPEQIATLFQGRPTPPSGGPKWAPEVGAVAASGDLAFTTGPVVPRNPTAEPFPPGAKYFTIWRRMSDGRWRYVVD